MSLRGTPPGTERRLWYHGREPVPSPLEPYVDKTYLIPVTEEGALGAPLYSHAMADPPECSSRIGRATTPLSGWFSDGLLLCRWNGTTLEQVQTSLGERPIVPYGLEIDDRDALAFVSLDAAARC